MLHAVYHYQFLLFSILASMVLIGVLSVSGGVQKSVSDITIIRPVWTGYLAPAFWLNVKLFVLKLADLSGFFDNSLLRHAVIGGLDAYHLIMVFVVGTFLVACYQVWNRFIRVDHEGVWKCEGIFPWTKTWDGLYWKDVERAWQIQGFVSWLLRSWSVEVKHRFMSDNRLLVDHMPSGTVSIINQNLEQRQAMV